MEAQSALIAALSAQEIRDWRKAVDSLAMIPRSSHYYDIEQLRTVSGYLCEELLEKALFMSRSGNVAQAKAVLVEIGEIQEVQDDCTSKRDALAATLAKTLPGIDDTKVDELMQTVAERRKEGKADTLVDVMVETGVVNKDVAKRIEKKVRQKLKSRIGDFEILKKLGEGGMGEVYLAQDQTL